jgi:hypothetical protein
MSYYFRIARHTDIVALQGQNPEQGNNSDTSELECKLILIEHGRAGLTLTFIVCQIYLPCITSYVPAQLAQLLWYSRLMFAAVVRGHLVL